MQRRLGVVRRMGRLGQVEIEQLRPILERQEHVARLDVAVKGLLAVRVVQRARQDHDDPGRLLARRYRERGNLPSRRLADRSGRWRIVDRRASPPARACGRRRRVSLVKRVPQSDRLARPLGRLDPL